MELSDLIIVPVLLFYSVLTRAIPPEDDYLPKLSPNLKPEKYEVRMTTELSEKIFMYGGTVQITVQCVYDTDSIEVHIRDLKIDEKNVWVTRVLSEGNESRGIGIKDQKKEKSDIYKIVLHQDMKADQKYMINIEYSLGPGFIPLWGFIAEKRSNIAYTKVSQLGARYVFPCFDQIDLKASFKIRHKHLSKYQGLSNAKSKSTKEALYQPQWVEDDYEETKPLSIFSIGLVLLKDSVEHEDTDVSLTEGINVKISTYEGNVSRFITHEVVCSIHNFFSKILRFPYSFEKLDFLIVPDYSNDCVGNYGFIFISESDASKFLVKDSESPKYEIISKLCFLMSQQWFGNTITMPNWYSNWLFHGFNHFFQVSCINEVRSEYKSRFSDIDMINSYIKTLKMGNLGRFNTIQRISPNSYYFRFKLFNEDTLNKVWHLVRMMEFFLGSGVFHKSINKIIEQFKFKNINLDEFWEHLTDIVKNVEINGAEIDETGTSETNVESQTNQSKFEKSKIIPVKLTLKEIIKPWHNYSNYPLITVKRNLESKMISVKQEPFPKVFTNVEELVPAGCWHIPLSFATKNNELEFDQVALRGWSSCGDEPFEVTISDMNSEDWFIFNIKMKVLCRVDYDRPTWMLIQKSLLIDDNYSGIDFLTRTQLVSDMLALAEVERMVYPFVLDSLKYLVKEEEYAPLNVALNEFKSIWKLLLRTELLEPFEAYVRSILEPKFEREEYSNIVELSPEGELKYLMEILLVESSCKFSMGNCKTISDGVMLKWKENSVGEFSKQIPKEFSTIIHCGAVKNDTEYWEQLRKHYNKDHKWNETYEEDIILEALACSHDTDILRKYLNQSIEKKYVTTRYDSRKIFESVLSNKRGYTIGKDFLKNNWNNINKFDYLTEDSSLTEFYLNTLLENTNTKKEYAELMVLAKEKGLMKYESVIDASKKAERNIDWHQQNEGALMKYFKGMLSRS